MGGDPPSGSGHPASCLRPTAPRGLPANPHVLPLPKGPIASSVLPVQLSLLHPPPNRVLFAAGSPQAHPAIPGHTPHHLTTPVLPGHCRALKLTSTDGGGCRVPGESVAGPLSKGMFPFPAPTPRAEASARHLPLSKPPAQVLALFSLVSDGFKVRGQSPWVPSTQALGVGSLSSEQPAPNERAFVPHGLRNPGPEPPLSQPARLPGVFPTTSSELTSKRSPTPDVKRTGRWLPGLSPEPPPHPVIPPKTNKQKQKTAEGKLELWNAWCHLTPGIPPRARWLRSGVSKFHTFQAVSRAPVKPSATSIW